MTPSRDELERFQQYLEIKATEIEARLMDGFSFAKTHTEMNELALTAAYRKAALDEIRMELTSDLTTATERETDG